MNFKKSKYEETSLYKVKHEKAYWSILNIINEVDPVGIAFVREEEYGIEVLEIMANLKSCSSAKETRGLIIDVFDGYFGMKTYHRLISIEVAANVFECLKLME